MPDLSIVDQDGDVVLAQLVLDDGISIEVVASVKLVQTTLFLYDFQLMVPGHRTCWRL
jgi:hypothetical protein